MSHHSNNHHSDGIGFFGLLFLIFLTLKLCDVIDWSWWWVTAPLWGPFVLFIAVVAIVCVVFMIAKMLEK